MKSYLIYGFKASGKTTYGVSLAKELNLIHIDLDKEILKDYDELNIFDLYNTLQDKFREIEYKKFLNIVNNKEIMVFSLGGSTLLNPKIDINELKKQFNFIFIDTDFDIIYKRIQKQKTIYNKYSYEELKVIYNDRIGYFKALT